MTKTVALDIGGVCIQLHQDRCFDYFGYSTAEMIPDAVTQAFDQFERGLMTEAEWLNIVRHNLNSDFKPPAAPQFNKATTGTAKSFERGSCNCDALAGCQFNLSAQEQLIASKQTGDEMVSDEVIRYGWNLMIGQDIPGIAKWIREMIADGYRFVYFSDTSQLHLLEVCRNFSVAHLIHGGIFSFDVRAKKPEAAMYEAFEAQYGKPDLYLDDRPANIAGGEKFGWNSQLFTSVETLQKNIVKI
jgi:putative hydrolase of the HAD superfamily